MNIDYKDFMKKYGIDANACSMKIYIASSWKNQHAVEMLTSLLREINNEVFSFIENNFGEDHNHVTQKMSFEEWVNSPESEQSFQYDTKGATESDLVIYIGPSGKDAAAEVGAAWAKGIPVLGLHAKGEDFGLMRKMIHWHYRYPDLIKTVKALMIKHGKKRKQVEEAEKYIQHMSQSVS
jgi:nucleoside 2-deoxyribosyltransferase